MGIVRERDDHHQNTPENFAIVETGIYRCSFPNSSNFSFIETLNLKSILCLCPEPYPEENIKFLQSKNIKLFQFGLQGTKKESVSEDTVTEAVNVLLDVRNHPILIHCKHGKHRTGCVVGCYRKVKNWCLSCVLKEYQRFAGEKARPSDMTFIENYNASSCLGQRFYSAISYGQQCLVYQEEMENNSALAAATAGGAICIALSLTLTMNCKNLSR